MKWVEARATQATAVGPFVVEESPELPWGSDLSFGAPGEPCWVEGTVRDLDGRPVAGARIELWEPGDGRAPGHVRTGTSGRYGFWACTPTSPARPGSPGGLPLRVRALHRQTLATHVLVTTPDADPSPAQVDTPLTSLVRIADREPPGTPAPAGRSLPTSSWVRLHFDIVLAPAGAARPASP